MSETIRPTKKQRELLTFIEQFIHEHGYSPSYREIMNGLSYTSVATVALHVNNLIKRGHLRKRDHSARSLEVVRAGISEAGTPAGVSETPGEQNWLTKKVEQFFTQAEQLRPLPQEQYDDLTVLVKALKVLELEQAVQKYTPRLEALKQCLVQPPEAIRL